MESDPRCPKHGNVMVWTRPMRLPGLDKDQPIETCYICGTPLWSYQRQCLGEQKPEPVTIRTFATYREIISPMAGPNLPREYYALCLCEEAGEVASIVKKHIFHGHPLDRDKLVKEIGDELWYLDQLARQFGITLEEVAAANVEKLRRRFPSGRFNTEESIARVDVNVETSSE